MRRTSPETCSTRSEIAHPCCGPRDRVLRMRRSRVPWGRSMRSPDIVTLSLLQEHSMPVSCRSARGEREFRQPGTGLQADFDTGAGVEVVAESVAEEVEAEHAEHDGDRRK